MTTCVAGVLRSHQTSAICLCHFDHIKQDVDLKKFQKICHQMSIVKTRLNDDHHNQDNGFDLFIIGGYKDEQNISDRLVLNVLNMFNQINPYLFHIRWIYCGATNTSWQSSRYAKPKLYGVAINVNDCQIQNALLARPLPIDVPMYDIRSLYISLNGSSEYMSIYDSQDELLQIPVLHIKRCYFSHAAKLYFEKILKFSDQEILNVSISNNNLFDLFNCPEYSFLSILNLYTRIFPHHQWLNQNILYQKNVNYFKSYMTIFAILVMIPVINL